MRRVRVLIVDDSTIIRRLLTEALAADPAIEVVGTAANGKIALAKIPQLNPDVVTLDVEMPELDGVATLRELRRSDRRLPVIMFSTLTEKGALATINALAAGASDYVAKPSNVGNVTAAIHKVRDELIPKIKTLCPWIREPAASPATSSALPNAAASKHLPQRSNAPIEVVAIGVSTGGPNALAEVFGSLPATLPAPVVVVQHMPPLFTSYLAQRLDSDSALAVKEATSGETLHAGGAWIAPGDYHLSLTPSGGDVRIRLHQSSPENSCRPAVDVLFRSVAELYGPRALAVVLTGMGQDGLRGCESIRQAGGRVLVQDEASSVVWGMPGAVARVGLADETLPLDRIAGRITQIVYASQPHRAVIGTAR